MKTPRIAIVLVACSVCVLASALAGAAERRPTTLPVMADFAVNEPVCSRVADRNVTTITYKIPQEWGYGDAAPLGRFVVVEPSKPIGHPPMLVYLHGAGGKAGAHFPQKLAGFGPEFLTLALECSPPKGPEGWYGWFWASSDRAKFAERYAPPENRYLAEIEWVARKYSVDRDRIYMWGHSMGGTGSLGLGMARGDIFAALLVGVPAGTDHVFFRIGFPDREAIVRKPTTTPSTKPAPGPTSQMTRGSDYLARVSAMGRPDAPPIINFSSQTDGWATNQENLLEACHDGRHLMIFCWAPFGHTQDYSTANPAVLEFPWLSIRRNEAYPVFTNASTDQKYPGLRNTEGDQHGQINGYFRWKSTADEANLLAMDLWLVTAKSLATTRPVTIPESSTVDITPRRLQKFALKPGQKYAWQLLEGAQVRQQGIAQADELGLLTIPRLTITSAPRALTIERAGIAGVPTRVR